MVDDMHHHIVDEDPLMISQTLTYVTDDGSVVHSFHSAPFSWGKFIVNFVELSGANLMFLSVLSIKASKLDSFFWRLSLLSF